MIWIGGMGRLLFHSGLENDAALGSLSVVVTQARGQLFELSRYVEYLSCVEHICFELR